MCTQAKPCLKISSALGTNRPYIKFQGTTSETATVSINNQNVTLLADPGAKLTRTGGGLLLEIRGSSHVAIFDLEVTNASGGGAGISIPNGSTAATLELHRAKVTNNSDVGIFISDGTALISQSIISGNQGGGILIQRGAMFDIENNFIINNGKAIAPMSSTQGGVAIIPDIAGAKFTFNTIAFNKNDGTVYHGGVTCAGGGVAAQGNLIYGNSEGLITSNATQSGGGCQFGNSLSLASAPGDLGFKNPTLPDMDLHLTAASPTTVVNAGGPCTGVDFDGDLRPIGSACDLGADEYHP